MKPAPSLLALILLSLSLNAAADQSSDRLDRLFANLQETHDADVAAGITRDIWQTWHESSDPQVSDLMEEGVSALLRRQYSRALDRFTRVTHAAPDFAEGWNKLATVNFYLGNLEASAKQVEKTLSLEPRHFGAISGRGMIRLAQGMPFEAASDFRQALQINPYLADLRERVEALERELIRNTVSVPSESPLLV